MFDDLSKPVRDKNKVAFPHYYGDQVRVFMLIIGLILLGSMLIDVELLGLNLIFGVITVLLFTLVAGFMSPINKKAMVVAVVGLGLLFLLFEYFAIGAVQGGHGFSDPVFLLRQTISVLSLIGFYFAVKSIRGMGVGE